MSYAQAYILECQPYDPVSATTKNVFFASNLPDDATLGQTTPYFVRLKQGFTHETAVFDQNVPGGTQISAGSAAINNTDGLLDYLLTYNWDGRPVTVKRGVPGAAYGTYVTEFVGSTLDLTADIQSLTLAIRDNSWKLAIPIQNNIYLGTGGKEGGLDIKQRRKPLLFGTGRNLAPMPTDIPRLIFQIHDGAINSVSKVYDRAVPLTFATDYANYAALLAAVIPAGCYGTCLAEGFIKLGAKLVSELTVDAIGAYSSVTNVPDLIKNLIKDKGGLTDSDLNLTLFSEATSDAPYAFEGLYLSDPSVQIDEVVETLAASINGFWFLTRAGKFALRQFKFRTPVLSVRAEDIGTLQRQLSPNELYRVKTNYGKNLTVQDASTFVLPKQTLNGFLKDNTIFVATALDGSGGVYTYTGEFAAYLNKTKVNDLGIVTFSNVTGSSWCVIDSAGVITVTDPGVDVASVTLTASLGEFTVSETFTLRKSKGASPKNLVLTTDLRQFYYDQNNIPVPGTQIATVTATGTNLTTPYTVTAVDNLGTNLTLGSSGSTRTLSIANLPNVMLTAWVLFTFTSTDGTVNTLRMTVLHGDDGYASGILSSLTIADSAGSSLNLATIGTLPPTVRGNVATKVSATTGFNSAVVGYMPLRGNAYVQSEISTTTNTTAIGLDDDLTTYVRDGAGAIVAYLQYNRSTGAWGVYISGTLSTSGTTTTGLTGGLLVIYDGIVFDFYINTTKMASVATTANQTLYPKWIAYDGGSIITGIMAGFATDRAWSNVGGLGRPSDYANLSTSGPAILPISSLSTPGDIYTTPNGVIYERVDSAGIVLGGYIIALGTTLPGLYWSPKAQQPVVAAGTTAIWSGVTGPYKPQDGADVTSLAQVVVEIVADKTVAADYIGTVSGTDLGNVSWSPTVTRGGTSIRYDNTTSYTLTDTYGGTFAVDNTTASGTKGMITISAITANTAGGNLNVSVSGVAQPKIAFTVAKVIAAPPPAAGSTVKTVTWVGGEYVAVNSITYVTIFNTVKTVALTTGESLYGNASIDYSVSGGGGASRNMTFKWQYSVAGANSWNDFTGSPVTGTDAYALDALQEQVGSPGHASVAQTKSGLSTNSYDIRIVAIDNTTGRYCTPSGTSTVEAKV